MNYVLLPSLKYCRFSKNMSVVCWNLRTFAINQRFCLIINGKIGGIVRKIRRNDMDKKGFIHEKMVICEYRHHSFSEWTLHMNTCIRQQKSQMYTTFSLYYSAFHVTQHMVDAWHDITSISTYCCKMHQ